MIRKLSRFIALLLLMSLGSLAGCQRDRPAVPAGTSPPASPSETHSTARSEARTSTQEFSVQAEDVVSTGDWPMFMRDFRATGRSEAPSLQPPLELIWKYKTGGPITASPIVAQQTVFIGSHDGVFYALDAGRWGERWHFDTGLSIRHAAAFWRGNVYFVASKHGTSRVYALNAATGDLLWQFTLPTWSMSPPRAHRGIVYVGAYEAKIYLLDALTGKVRKEEASRVRIGDANYLCLQGNLRPYPPIYANEPWKDKIPYTTALPVEAGDFAYLGASDGKFYVLEKPSWEPVWHYPTRGAIEAPAAIAYDTLFFGSRDGYLYAVRPQTPGKRPGEPQSLRTGTVTHNNASVFAEPSVSASQVAILHDGVELPWLDRRNGWFQVRLPDGRMGWMSSDDFTTFAGSDDRLRYNPLQISQVETRLLPQGAEFPRWSPDGTRVVFFKRLDLRSQFWNAGEIWTADRDLKRVRKICVGRFFNPNLSWSLDGKWITFESTEADVAYVWVVQADGHDLTRLAKGDAPSFSPQAHRIAFRIWAEGQDQLWTVTINGDDLTKLMEVPIEGVVRQFTYLEPPIWSPDGQFIAFGVDGQHYVDGKARILLVDREGRVVQQVLTHSGTVQALRWSRNMRYLAFVLSQNPEQAEEGADDRLLNVKDLSVPDAPRVFDAIDGSWSPDGNWLAILEREPCAGLRWKVWAWHVSTGRKVPLVRANAPLRAVQWVSEDTLGLWATSGYLRDNKFQPARTEGWILHLKQPLGE